MNEMNEMNELNPDDKILIAYHAKCIDGFTSAWACWRGLIMTTSILSENIDLMEMTYGKLDEVEEAAEVYDRIYFVDFSAPIDVLNGISMDSTVVVIDHHKTAIDMYEGFSYLRDRIKLVLDTTECGASLVWNHFLPNQYLPQLIKSVRDYDLWQFKLPHTREINKYLRVQKKTLGNWSALMEELDNNISYEKAFIKGAAIKAYHDTIVSSLVEQAEPCELNRQQGLVVNCSPHFSSDVGHELALISGTFGATWQQEPGGEVKWSLRSNGDYDVSAIAKSFGGGGHKNAAGFTLKAPTEDVTKLGITLWAS